MEAKAAPRWRAIGKSLTGARHKRAERGNQDRIAWLPESGDGYPLVLSVADGHGSAEYTRSGVGAEIAVFAATSELISLAEPVEDEVSLTAVKRAATERLPQVLVRRWKELVDENLAEHPVMDKEFAWIERQAGTRRRRAVERNPYRLYGTTLVAALVTDAYAIYLQLGDGDIMIVADDGTVRQPFPRDPRFLANETTSMASDDAWREVQVSFQALAGSPPALITLSTDGYANSFRDLSDFLRVGSDVLDLLREHGPDAVALDVQDWLADAALVSGDDVTLGILCRLEALAAPLVRRSALVPPAKDEQSLADPVDEAMDDEVAASADTADADAGADLCETAADLPVVAVPDSADAPGASRAEHAASAASEPDDERTGDAERDESVPAAADIGARALAKWIAGKRSDAGSSGPSVSTEAAEPIEPRATSPSVDEPGNATERDAEATGEGEKV